MRDFRAQCGEPRVARGLRRRSGLLQKCFDLVQLAAPLPHIRFCPTGGINQKNAANYLALANIICVGGSWVAPADAIRARDWSRVTELSRAAVALRA